MRALIVILLVASCGGDEASYIIVTVDRRPAVHNVAKLEVTLSNGGTQRSDELLINAQMFPVTFSISAPGRTGDLGISIDAFDSEDLLVGRGVGTTTLLEDTAAVTIDSADFVVNTDPFAGDQFLTDDFEAVGFQLSAISNNTWMALYRDTCTSCNIFGRRFDSTGLAVESAIASGTNAFSVSTTLTSGGAMPATAASGLTTLAFWDYADTVGTGRGIACRTFNEMGAANPGQLNVMTSETADVVAAAPLNNGNFVLTWQTFISPSNQVRTMLVRNDCVMFSPGPVTVSSSTSMFGSSRAHVGVNGNNILYAWIADGDVRVRHATNTGAFTAGTEQIIVPKSAAMELEHVRVSPYGTGFAVATRWSSIGNSMGPGKIEVYRTTATGVVMGTPILITDQSQSDFASNQGFSVAQRTDGALLVVWHVCPTGPGSCEVYGRILRPTGAPVGDPFVIPTATGSDQVSPSVIALDSTPPAFVAAWNDKSAEAPDKAGRAVRARILYPVYDDARSVHGATCGSSAPGAPACGAGLACAMGSDAVQRCYVTCTPPSCPGGGTCSTVDASTSACTF